MGLGYSVHPGNENDGKTFPSVYEKINHLDIEVVVGDTAYKTPAIAHKLKENGIALLSTYSRPKTKNGFFCKYEYVYDEYYDSYLCPENQILSYSTTIRDGYREYKSDPRICEHCPHLKQCTLSKEHVKVVTRHVWQEDVIQKTRSLPMPKAAWSTDCRAPHGARFLYLTDAE